MMKVQQLLFESGEEWEVFGEEKTLEPQLVVFFGGKEVLRGRSIQESLQKQFPDAILLGSTTAGEILGEEVFDDSVVATAIEFEKTKIQLASMLFSEAGDSFLLGKSLAEKFEPAGLQGLFVLSDGHMVNGSLLVQGLTSVLGKEMLITGGLAGDGPNFEETWVAANTPLESGRVGVVGFYGEHIVMGHGSVGGWDAFGPERMITRSTENVLFELDGKPALELYKKYLGEEAENLPGSALQFPLAIRPSDLQEIGTVRTILSVDEVEGSMTFAGDVPEGNIAQLMMANFDRLIDGAAEAASSAREESIESCEGDKLAILVSCVGRKIVLGQRTADEVEAVADILGENHSSIGFYSYGEISPHSETGFCDLHNQTMTITYFAEKA